METKIEKISTPTTDWHDNLWLPSEAPPTTWDWEQHWPDTAETETSGQINGKLDTPKSSRFENHSLPRKSEREDGDHKELSKQAGLCKKGQENKRLEGGTNKEGGEEEAVSLCDRLMLVSSLFSIEMCFSFQQLYQVLFLQFLGVPLSLVSLNGIVGGAAGMLLLPLVGSWADGGNNSKQRKKIAMSGSMVVFVSGLSLLIVASYTKILAFYKVRTTMATLIPNSSLVSTYNISDEHFNFNDYALVTTQVLTRNSLSNTTSSYDFDGKERSSVETVALSILGFMCLDMGFDMTTILSRAAILDVVPKFQQNSVLVLATIVQSVAGFVCAALGCLDLPVVLGSTFDTDGIAATLIFFCVILITAVLASFSLMGVANHRLKKRKTSRSQPISSSDSGLPDSRGDIRGESETQSSFEQLDERGWVSQKGPASCLKNLTENGVLSKRILSSGTTDARKRPLLLDNLKTNYCTIHADAPWGKFTEVEPGLSCTGHNFLEVNTFGDKKFLEKFEDSRSDSSITDETCGTASSDCIYQYVEEATVLDKGLTSVMGANNQPHPLHITHLEALNELEMEKATEAEEVPKQSLEDWEERYRKMKKKLAILGVSNFFSVGASLSFSLYAFNAFNIGIMHGDPTALPGSEGRRNYEKGLKLGSFGNMVFYSAFMLISLANGRVIHLIGERGQFVINHVMLILILVAVVIFERLEVFMVFIGCCGLFRPCMLTLPFVMAHKFSQEGMKNDEEKSGQKVSRTGRAITLIGFLISAQYMILSIVMGPVMDATGNPWVPLYYCLGTGSISLGVFSFIFLV